MIAYLNYPFDSSIILRKKKSIKKELLLNEPTSKLNIAILGGSTTSEIKNILELFLLKHGYLPSFYESEYNQYYEDAVFGNEALTKFAPDFIYIHTTNANITSFPSYNMDEEEVGQLLNNEISKYSNIWRALEKYNCPIIQNNFDLPINRSLGNLDCYDIHGKTHFISSLNLEFAKQARQLKNLHLNDINYLSSLIGIKNWYDKSLWHTAKYAVSFDAIPQLTHNISNIIAGILGKSKKCLVLDLDNTCWGGVIGDDGLNGIGLGNETAYGESFMYFQNFVKELKNRGIILAVCSKNELAIAKEGFTHSDSVLKFEDFVSFKANWDPKHQNIFTIAEEINIGLDSLVFIDDNPVERNIVSAQIPNIAVPEVGSDVVEFVDHIERNGYFETVSMSKDDLDRNKFYEQNSGRVKEQSLFENYNDFLKSLEMTAEIKTFDPVYIDRITQLINKTNQFNLTTKRYTIGEIESILLNKSYIKIYGKLVDKLGDNGLISALIGEIKAQTCHIDLWIMSCRVFKRDMEFAMFDTFVEKCVEQGVNKIIGYYDKTPKNAVVSELYHTLGFVRIKDGGADSIWELAINSYSFKNKIIKIN
jgi:FkbH-like protein